MALRVLALGGIYLLGGITVKVLEKIKDGTFFRCFCDKSNFAPILARIPIYVIVNQDAPLWGAAYQALAAAELALPILEVVPLQLFAYHTAVSRGPDVDHPREPGQSGGQGIAAHGEKPKVATGNPGGLRRGCSPRLPRHIWLILRSRRRLRNLT